MKDDATDGTRQGVLEVRRVRRKIGMSGLAPQRQGYGGVEAGEGRGWANPPRRSISWSFACRAGAPMTLLTTLLMLAMLATLGVLAVGLAGFFHGGEFNRKYGSKLMQARVALQALAILLLLMVLLSAS